MSLNRLEKLLFQVLTIALISLCLETTADIIVQPGFTEGTTQRPQIYPQSLTTQSQQGLERSQFGLGQSQLVPIYAHGHQGGVAYRVGHPLLHYPHYPRYPHYPGYIHYPQFHVYPRYAPQRHLRVLKVGGHKVYHPSWLVGQPPVPLAVHHRYKKSVGEEPNSGEHGESVPNSTDSSLNKLTSSSENIQDKNAETRQGNNDRSNAKTNFGLNPRFLMNPERSEPKSSESIKEPGISVEKTSSSTSNPNARNFPDPRPDPPAHKTSHQKSSNLIPKNIPETTTRHHEINPAHESSKMEEDKILGTIHHVQEHSMQPVIPNYYQAMPCVNVIPPTAQYQQPYTYEPWKPYGDQELWNEQRIDANDATKTTHIQPNNFLGDYYMTTCTLGYPNAYYVSSSYLPQSVYV